jgi:hypothetical protein
MTARDRLFTFLAGVSLILISGATIYATGGALCENTIASRASSPDGKKIAIVFERDCGATTGLSTHVSLIDNTNQLDDEHGNVFVADKGRGPRGPSVETRWADSPSLIVSHDKTARIFKAVTKVGPVAITYTSE